MIAVFQKGVLDLFDVVEILCFQQQPEIAAVHVRALVGALVVDRNDVSAKTRNNTGNALKLTGLVDQLKIERAGASRHEQSSLDDAGENGHVDVAARNHTDDLLALDRHFVEHCRRDRNRARALGDHLLLLDKGEDGGGDLVVGDGDDVVNVLLTGVERNSARFLDRDTIGDGGDGGQTLYLAVVDGIEHAGSAGCLHAVDLDIGIELLDGEGNAGDESAAADRNDDRVRVGQLVENFQTDSALSRDNPVVIKGMNEGVALLVAQIERSLIGVVVNAVDKADVRAELAGGLHLGDGGAVRQADQRLDAALGGSEGNALRVVAGGAGDDAPCLFLVGEGSDLIVSASDLEGACHLKTFRLQVYVRLGIQLGSVNQIRAAQDALEHIGGVIEFVQ